MFKVLFLVLFSLLVGGCNKKILVVEKPVAISKYKFVRVHFTAGSSSLSGGGVLEVLANINTLRASGLRNYAIIGHACESESSDKLAQARAEAVKKALWNFGIDTEKAELYIGGAVSGIDCGFVEIVEK